MLCNETNADMVPLKDSGVSRGTVTITSHTGEVSIRIRTRPLPKAVTEFLSKYSESMKFFVARTARIDEDLTTERVSLEKRLSFSEFKTKLEAILSNAGNEWRTVVDRYASLMRY